MIACNIELCEIIQLFDTRVLTLTIKKRIDKDNLIVIQQYVVINNIKCKYLLCACQWLKIKKIRYVNTANTDNFIFDNRDKFRQNAPKGNTLFWIIIQSSPTEKQS